MYAADEPCSELAPIRPEFRGKLAELSRECRIVGDDSRFGLREHPRDVSQGMALRVHELPGLSKESGPVRAEMSEERRVPVRRQHPEHAEQLSCTGGGHLCLSPGVGAILRVPHAPSVFIEEARASSDGFPCAHDVVVRAAPVDKLRRRWSIWHQELGVSVMS